MMMMMMMYLGCRPAIPKGRYPQREITNQMSVVLYVPKLGLGIELGSGPTTQGEANCTNTSISIPLTLLFPAYCTHDRRQLTEGAGKIS